MNKRVYDVGEIVKANDGDLYQILGVTPSTVPSMPHLARYTVLRGKDGATIENFPGYSIEGP